MSDALNWTEAERQALVGAMQQSFGGCSCQQWVPDGHKQRWQTQCEGHAFLAEPHRLARLLWVRRTRADWLIADYVGRCPKCNRPSQSFPIGQTGACVECDVPEPEPQVVPVEPPAPFTLPW